MYIWTENYKGGINNLVVVKGNGVVATSLKSKERAIKNYLRKIKAVKEVSL